ncbi:MAG TPA: arylesterase [Hyphomicrobium sp.]|jgi:acyl-CoA thioesterase-1
MKAMERVRNGCGFAQVVGILALVNVLAATIGPESALAGAAKPLRIVAFGDSLTSGYGLRPSQSFPVQLQKALKERGHNVVVTNAGVAGDTTAGGLERLEWAVPDGTDAVIVELGANDALRGIDPKVTRTNLEKIIASLKERRIPILLAGMRSPANWGETYSEDFDGVFPKLARANGLVFYPFFLDGVVLDPKLNQDDGMHPSGKGVAEIVKRMLPVVEELIARAQSQRASASKS